MKKTYYIFSLLFLLSAAVLPGCTTEEKAEDGQGVPVTITIETATRSGETHAGSGIDSQVDKVRVLGYRASDYTLAFNEVVSVDATGSDLPNGIIKGTITVKTGKFHFVFIANEASDAALAAKLADNSRIATWVQLKELSFSRSAFSSTLSIPMVTLVENVKVTGDDALQTPAETISGTPWNVALERLAARLDLTVDMSDAYYASGMQYISLQLTNIPDRVYLLQRENTDNTSTYTVPVSPRTMTSPAVTLKWDRIILPEVWFTDTDDESCGVEIQLTSSGVLKKGMIAWGDDNDDYTLPRNHFFDLRGTVYDSETDLGLRAIVTDWSEAPLKDTELF